MSSLPNNSSSSAVDDFLRANLMESLQIPNQVDNPSLSLSLEDYLYGEDDLEIPPFEDGREELIRKERTLEQEVIKIIDSGKGDSLMPNSGQAVSVLDHSICVRCHEDDEGECMVWEWHGHITAYTQEYGFSPEYIHGSYFQRLRRTTRPVAVSSHGKEEEEKGHQGLKDLIADGKDSNAGRILHRNHNALSS